MTEKEKMLKGLLYDANYDKELGSERLKAKDLCFKYNTTLPSDEESLRKIICELKIKTKGNFFLTPPFSTINSVRKKLISILHYFCIMKM
ncbi:maltose acetyltransferase domain-containing protein [Anaerococcus marasmi]|uniref:maltose acetyltransferase domain-containing protein n=1 Tax=Anaerococcus marasmi TaxID=2057797 RepID=UPI001F0741C2|nr:maltose acetyltransferase domain-containing protein [Anaerococcus marasmi]